MFDHFRAFFLGVFQLHTLAYVAPLCIAFRCVRFGLAQQVAGWLTVVIRVL